MTDGRVGLTTSSIHGEPQPHASESDTSDDVDVKIYTNTPPRKPSTRSLHAPHPSRAHLLQTNHAETHTQAESVRDSRSFDRNTSVSLEAHQTVDSKNDNCMSVDHVISHCDSLSALFWSEKQKKYCS